MLALQGRDREIERMTPTRFRLQELLAAQEPPISQYELARRSGVSRVTINAIAQNKTTRVDLATLGALAKALEVEPGELLEHVSDGKRKRR